MYILVDKVIFQKEVDGGNCGFDSLSILYGIKSRFLHAKRIASLAFAVPNAL